MTPPPPPPFEFFSPPPDQNCALLDTFFGPSPFCPLIFPFLSPGKRSTSISSLPYDLSTLSFIPPLSLSSLFVSVTPLHWYCPRSCPQASFPSSFLRINFFVFFFFFLLPPLCLKPLLYRQDHFCLNMIQESSLDFHVPTIHPPCPFLLFANHLIFFFFVVL